MFAHLIRASLSLNRTDSTIKCDFIFKKSQNIMKNNPLARFSKDILIQFKFNRTDSTIGCDFFGKLSLLASQRRTSIFFLAVSATSVKQIRFTLCSSQTSETTFSEAVRIHYNLVDTRREGQTYCF